MLLQVYWAPAITFAESIRWVSIRRPLSIVSRGCFAPGRPRPGSAEIHRCPDALNRARHQQAAGTIEWA